MVEGGAALVTSLLKGGLWDALTVFVAPLILGEGIAAVGDLGILSPDRGIAFEYFRFESGQASLASTRRAAGKRTAEGGSAMFTGLIEEVGEHRLASSRSDGTETRNTLPHPGSRS